MNLLYQCSTQPPRQQPTHRVTRSMTANANKVGSSQSNNNDTTTSAEPIAKAVHVETDETTGQTYNVTGDIIAEPITMPEVGGKTDEQDSTDTEISVIWTDEMVQATKNIGGMSELVDMFLMHMCIQSDPGEPTNWKDALNGPEREWWL